MKLIDADALKSELLRMGFFPAIVKAAIERMPSVDAVEVIRCQNCAHAEPLDHNCELSTSYYLHCKLWRGEETKNVWHRIFRNVSQNEGGSVMCGKCEVVIKPDGVHELAQHRFVLAEKYKNVTVEILKCESCGEVSVGWYRQENTERVSDG